MKHSKLTQKTQKEINRSGKAPCAICNQINILQNHHIEGRNIPNYNRFSNIVPCCPNCHNKIHWGQIIIEKWIMTSGGMELIWHKKGEESFTGDISVSHNIQPKK